jgi:hypothetical protein
MERLDRPADRLAATDVIGTSRSAFWRQEQQAARHRAAKNAFIFHASHQHARSFEMQLGQ